MSLIAPARSTSDFDGSGRGKPQMIQAVPFRHPGRWACAVVILAFAAMLAQSLVTNENFRWDVVGTYFMDVLVIQ